MNEIELVGTEATAGSSDDPAAVDPRDRPWLFGLLIAPSAVMANGVVQGGMLAFFLSERGVGSEAQSHLMAMLAFPTIWYFLWSPITDYFVRRRTWLIAGSWIAALLLFAGFHQAKLTGLTAKVLMLGAACCVQLAVSSCGGMMGAMRSAGSKRLAGSVYQAGSMGFGALSAALLMWMSSRTSQDTLGLTAAAMIALPTLFAFWAPKQQEIATGSFAATMNRVWLECKATFWRVEALPYIACMTFPMASGAAIGLLPGVGKQYGVSGDHVALFNGLLGGVLMATGSAAMATIRTRARASVVYMIVALINCATLCVLWLGPLRPSSYFAGAGLYLFTVGACYAMFTAVVLEFMGASGKSGSGRYSIINGMGNLPPVYMLYIDGWGAGRWGGRGLAGAEAVVGAVGAVLLLGWLLSIKPPASAEIPVA